jgi:hypothetical protein
MYTQVNSEKIKLNFNSGISCTIEGPDSDYYVQVSEFVKGNDLPKYVEGYGISGVNPQGNRFSLPIEFYMDFEIQVFKFVDGFGFVRIFTHRYNDYGQYVKFVLDSKYLEECKLWVEQIKYYSKIRGCKVILETPFDTLNKEFVSNYNVKIIEPYKTYKIGRFPKISNDFRTVDERCEGLIWFGYWKKFWSYQHPRIWNQINSLDIVNDILGL